MKFTKKRFFDVAWVLVFALILIPTSRAWLLKLISLSPSIENVSDRIPLSTYNWQLKGVNTQDVDFLDLQNKVIFVNFWATWCPGCIAEKPSIQALYNDYKDQVVFLTVTSDSKEKVDVYFKKKGFNLPVYHLMTREPKELSTETIPTTFVIDKNGMIVIKSGRADWNTDKIRDYLDLLIEA
ncbi:MAG: TlpA family protein disulfide reductase [Flavobacteriaceae bacterium]|nr:TlpA family protein disulfide reductase [Flavobacteriaceae bacterium]